MLNCAIAAREFVFGPFAFNPDPGILFRDGVPVEIGQRAVSLLTALLVADRRVVGKSELMDAAWPGLAVEESNLSVQIAALRKILGPAPGGGKWIVTVPRVGYRWAGPAEGIANAADIGNVARSDKPGIAVLPFSNLGGDAENDYLADGISEDIIATLARYRWFHVIARNSSFAFRDQTAGTSKIAHDLGVRYLLDGSVRRAGDRMRIVSHLIDAAAGTEIWAGRYDMEMANVFAVQDDLAERVAGAIEPELLWTEGIPPPVRHTGDIPAWDLVRRGMWYFHQVSLPTHREARACFRQACARDPHLPEAHLWLGRVNAGFIAYGWSNTPDADRQEGLAASLRAIALDDRNPYAHYALAIVSAYSDRLEQAERAAERAVELSPSFALGHRVLGMTRLFRGAAMDAVEPLAHSFRLCPHDPQNAVWLHLLALAQLFAGRRAEALRVTNRALAVRPDWRPTHELRAAVFRSLGRPDTAHSCLTEATRLPVPRSDALQPLWANNPKWRAEFDRLVDPTFL
jgi:TolB-like protein/Flp pilus assembly protein TadD